MVDGYVDTMDAVVSFACIDNSNFLERSQRKCNPAYNLGSCCTSSAPCGEGQGDCDHDDQCAGDLVCGTDNCAAGHRNMDCCTSKFESCSL